LPSGSWSIDANGVVGTPVLNPPSATGDLTGTMFGSSINGYYNSTTQKITIMRVSTPGDFSTVQIFTGYLFHTGTRNDLAGSFLAFNGTGGSASESDFGWFAIK
jgi:hypothetical protein